MNPEEMYKPHRYAFYDLKRLLNLMGVKFDYTFGTVRAYVTRLVAMRVIK